MPYDGTIAYDYLASNGELTINVYNTSDELSYYSDGTIAIGKVERIRISSIYAEPSRIHFSTFNAYGGGTDLATIDSNILNYTITLINNETEQETFFKITNAIEHGAFGNIETNFNSNIFAGLTTTPSSYDLIISR